MYALVESGSITKIFTNPKGFVLNNIQYPADIFSKWTKDEKEAIGIYEVITDSTNKKDEEYFINTNEEYNYADNQVTRSWGTATPKRLEDEDAKDQDGNNILDEDVPIVYDAANFSYDSKHHDPRGRLFYFGLKLLR